MIDLTAPFAALVLEIDELLHGPLKTDRANVIQRQRREGLWRGDDMMMLQGYAPQPQPPGDWVRRANCLGPNEMMVLPVGSLRASQRRMRELAEPAKQLCQLCQVRNDCRTWALTTPDPATDHVAGGMTPYERQLERRRILGIHPL